MIIGEFTPENFPGKDEHYFESRNIDLDLRGEIYIAESAHLGRGVRFITAAHSVINTKIGGMKSTRFTRSKIVLEENVFINAYAILYNTRIGENSIVAAGTVIAGRNVAPNVMVMGNPAFVVARFIDGHWHYDRSYAGELK